MEQLDSQAMIQSILQAACAYSIVQKDLSRGLAI